MGVTENRISANSNRLYLKINEAVKMNVFLLLNNIGFICQKCLREKECVFTSLDILGTDITNPTDWFFPNTND